MPVETVAIIGAAGYTGSLLTEALVRDGHDVIAADNLIYDRPAAVREILPNSLRRVNAMLGGRSLEHALREDLTIGQGWLHQGYFRFERLDVRKQQQVDDFIQRIKPSVVVNLAGLVGIGACAVDLNNTFATNRLGALYVATAAFESDAVRLYIEPSSSSVYDKSGTEPVNEDYPLPDPESLDPYGKYKILEEVDVKKLARKYKDKVWFMPRFATLIGLSPRMRLDLLANQAAYSLTAVSGYYDLANPNDKRALMSVADATRLYRTVISHPDPVSGIFNAGSMNLSKQEVLNQLLELADLDRRAIVYTDSAGDLRNLAIDSGRVRDTYGFEAILSLRETMQPFVDLLGKDRRVFARYSGNPHFVDQEFTNIPPDNFASALNAPMATLLARLKAKDN